MKPFSLAFLLLFSFARAGGSQGLFPDGVPASAVNTLKCRSGRTIQTFSPNTQSIRMIYRGELRVLMYQPNPPGQDVMNVGIRYTDISRAGEQMFVMPTIGKGLEWRSFPKSNAVLLYGITQDVAGKRQYTLLERCHE